MQNQPLVSVGIPTFNRASKLKKAIESVLEQDYYNLEVVISDNASTDSTQAICLEFCQRDNRIKYIRQPVNAGASNNFNEVLKHSQGEFFMWLGDDDWLDSSYISQCVEVLIEESDYSLVCGKANYFVNEVFAYEATMINLMQKNRYQRMLAYYRAVSDNGTFYGVMRREQISKVPMHNTMGSDWLMIADIAFLGKIKTIPDVAVNREDTSVGNDFKKLAKGMGLPDFQGNHPYLSIAISASKNILSSLQIYESLNLIQRFNLSVKVFIAIFLEKHMFPFCRDNCLMFFRLITPKWTYSKFRDFYRHTISKT